MQVVYYKCASPIAHSNQGFDIIGGFGYETMSIQHTTQVPAEMYEFLLGRTCQKTYKFINMLANNKFVLICTMSDLVNGAVPFALMYHDGRWFVSTCDELKTYRDFGFDKRQIGHKYTVIAKKFHNATNTIGRKLFKIEIVE
jgi:hypothetical protein